MAAFLYEYQKRAVDNLRSGSILCGGVGSGKSRTAIAYYFSKECGADLEVESGLFEMKYPRDLYIITTAKKRDSQEWEEEFPIFLLTTDRETNRYGVSVTVDSWNNINRYTSVVNAFFIFDEQKLVSYGSWTKSFLKITERNRWILLSATPGDRWSDYMAVFIANGFYRNKTEFLRRHVVFSQHSSYPIIDHYVDCAVLAKHKRQITVDMVYDKETVSHSKLDILPYDEERFQRVYRDRWNIFKDQPIVNSNEWYYCMRRASSLNQSRLDRLKAVWEAKKKVIVFYNFDDELKYILSFLERENIPVFQYNGSVHDPVPTSDSWVYLVQYNAGAESWNCTKTDCIVFYSLNYSYRIMAQSAGRIDRSNTQYKDLYYDVFTSDNILEKKIMEAIRKKKKFNEKSMKF